MVTAEGFAKDFAEMPLIENRPHLWLPEPPGGHIGQGMGRVIPRGKVLHRVSLWCP